MRFTAEDTRSISLSELFRAVLVGFAIVFAIMLVLVPLFPQILSYVVVVRIAEEKIQFFWGAFFVSIPATLVLMLRRPLVTRLSFATVYRLREFGEKLILGAFFIMMALSVLAGFWSNALVREIVSLANFWLTEMFVIGIAVNYYGGSFCSDRLPAMCFSQAAEEEHRVSKARWIANAFKHLREYGLELGLNLKTSEFQRRLSIRLFEGEDVNSDLQSISRSLSERKSPLVTLDRVRLGWRRLPWATIKSSRIEQLGSYFKGADKLVSLLSALGGILGGVGCFSCSCDTTMNCDCATDIKMAQTWKFKSL